MSEGCVFIGGEYVSPEDAKMSIFDAGFVWSDTVYDVTSTWAGWFFMLDEHLERFAHSCAGFRLENPYSADDMRRILAECVARTGHDNCYVKIQLTRGVINSETRDPRLGAPEFVAYATPYAWIWGEEKCRQRRRALPQRRRACLVEGDRRPLQELQPGGLRACPLRGLRPRLRRRAAGGRRRLAYRGAGLQHLRRAGRQGRDAGRQRSGGHHAARGGRALRRGRHPLRLPQGRAGGARRGGRAVREHHGRRRHAGGAAWRQSPSATPMQASSPAASSPATGASAPTAGTARGWRTSTTRPRRTGASSLPIRRTMVRCPAQGVAARIAPCAVRKKTPPPHPGPLRPQGGEGERAAPPASPLRPTGPSGPDGATAPRANARKPSERSERPATEGYKQVGRGTGEGGVRAVPMLPVAQSSARRTAIARTTLRACATSHLST